MATTPRSQLPHYEAGPAGGYTEPDDASGTTPATEAAPCRWAAGTPEEHRRAFEALFERYHARIYDYVARLLCSTEDASDVTQDVFLKAYRKLPETVARGDFRPEAWLFRIATNACRDLLRHRSLLTWWPLDRLVPWRTHRSSAWLFEPASRYLVGNPAAADAEAGEIADPAGWGDPQHLALLREEAAEVQATLARLRVEYRTVLLLREYRQLSYDEMAEVLSTTRSGVKSMLFRARTEFRRFWPGAWPTAH